MEVICVSGSPVSPFAARVRCAIPITVIYNAHVYLTLRILRKLLRSIPELRRAHGCVDVKKRDRKKNILIIIP